MGSPATPATVAAFPIPPPLQQLPWDTKGGFLTPSSLGFLQLLWAAIQGQGGIVDQFSAQITAPGALLASSLVNIYDSGGGAFGLRTADSAAAIGDLHWAQGFVRAATAPGALATVYFSGILGGLVGLTPGPVFMGLDGAVTQMAPVAGVSLIVGIAVSPTSLAFMPGQPFGL